MLRFGLFDLDQTLYTGATGLWQAIGDRIEAYLARRLNLDRAGAAALRQRYGRQYGTALAGLMAEHGDDPHGFLQFVHELPLEHYLQPDPALNGMLARLPLAKAIFTNSDAPHARRVLTALGVERHFTAIIDIHALGFVSKPNPGAYQIALETLGARPAECVLIDDMARNLAPGRALGMLTVLVGDEPAGDGVDYHVPDVLGVERVLAGLLGQRS